jgi:hypothetical protein
VHCQHYYLSVRQALRELGYALYTVHPGQIDIHQHYPRTQIWQVTDRLFTVGKRADTLHTWCTLQHGLNGASQA